MNVVLFGDSLTFGYGVWPKDNLESLLKAACPAWNIINSGVNGDTTREAAERFSADVLSHQPDLVTFLFGSNDSAMGEGPYRTLTEFQQNYQTMLETLKQQCPQCQILLITPPPVDETVFMPWNYNDRIVPYVEACRTLAKKHQTLLADFHAALCHLAGKGLQQLEIYVQEDGCHLSESGYLVLRDCILDALKKGGILPR